jgi:hypothetical protein
MNSQIVYAVFTALKTAEELAPPNAALLKNFRRKIQLDYRSCGAQSVYAILKFFGKLCSSQSVEHALKTDESGTVVRDCSVSEPTGKIVLEVKRWI